MDLCWSCQAAVEPGRSHCKVCDAAQPTRPDPTLVAPPPGYGTPAPLPAPPAHGYGTPAPPPAPAPAPTYGAPVQGYPPAPAHPGPAYAAPAPAYAAPAYAVPTAYVVPVAAPLKSKAVAALLCFFLGGLGIHRFYTGQTGLGLALLLTTLILTPLTFGAWALVTFIWVLVDFIMILAGGVSDQYGRELG